MLDEDGFEAGWYGVDDNPETIAKRLCDKGITDFIFAIDGKGQFSIGFSVWTKKLESSEDDE